MASLMEQIDRRAGEAGFSGVVRIDRGDELEVAAAYGMAHRGYLVPNMIDTRFGIASGTKGLTALTIVSLIAEGRLDLATTARSLLGDDLLAIDDGVTVEHLLAHRSGIGDYVDEDLGGDVSDYILAVPVHTLGRTEGYVRALDGYPTKFPPGERFSYCNSGYVVLALMAERATGRAFAELVAERVCESARMIDTAFSRSDEPDGRTALGYLDDDLDDSGEAGPEGLRANGLRTNVMHLPVCGSGDGGIISTAADIRSFWVALFAGRIVSLEWVSAVTRTRSEVPSEPMRYGLGFWLPATNDSVALVGMDAGVSFRSVHDAGRNSTFTVISNTSHGAWPMARLLDDLLAGR